MIETAAAAYAQLAPSSSRTGFARLSVEEQRDEFSERSASGMRQPARYLGIKESREKSTMRRGRSVDMATSPRHIVGLWLDERRTLHAR